MTIEKRPKAPGGLGIAGRRLWSSIAPRFELDEREALILAAAAHQADDVAALEALVEQQGLTVLGSTGQERLHPAVIEVRQGRVALARLLGSLDLPRDEEDEVPRTASSQRASKAAQAAWAQRRQRQDRRRRGPA